MMRSTAVITAIAVLCLGHVAEADVFNMGTGLTNLETVAVGDPGNAGDPNTFGGAWGSVSQPYRIGKYEVTAAQYTDFLNYKAKSDPHGLYNPYMWSEYQGCKIQRSGTSGSYSYTVASDWANRPVNYVGYWDACRFANWLHNGQGYGDTEAGAYPLGDYNGHDGRWIGRNATAKWCLPTEDEWYKSAYYKGAGTDAGYWDYPTQSNSRPSRLLGNPTDPGNNATYYNNGYTIDSPYYRTEVGAHENSESAYGTYDQGGNVQEWNESIIYHMSSGEISRGVRGGTFTDSYHYLLTSGWGGAFPDFERSTLGFRVAAVSEPMSLATMICGLGSLGLAFRRRRCR